MNIVIMFMDSWSCYKPTTCLCPQSVACNSMSVYVSLMSLSYIHDCLLSLLMFKCTINRKEESIDALTVAKHGTTLTDHHIRISSKSYFLCRVDHNLQMYRFNSTRICIKKSSIIKSGEIVCFKP